MFNSIRFNRMAKMIQASMFCATSSINRQRGRGRGQRRGQRVRHQRSAASLLSASVSKCRTRPHHTDTCTFAARERTGPLGGSFFLAQVVEVVAAVNARERLAERLLERRVVGLVVGQELLEVGAERREAGEGICSAPWRELADLYVFPKWATIVSGAYAQSNVR